LGFYEPDSDERSDIGRFYIWFPVVLGHTPLYADFDNLKGGLRLSGPEYAYLISA
jgi:hypothetical protein